MISDTLNIWGKELLDSTRDRKALSQALVIPLLLGIVYAIMNPIMNNVFTARAREPIALPAQGLEYADDAFIRTLEAFEISLEPFSGDMASAIERGEEKAGLIIPAGFDQAIAGEEPAAVRLLHNPAAGGLFGSSISTERIDFAISSYNQTEVAERMQERQIDSQLLTPVILMRENLATPEQRAGASAAFFLPILIGVLAAQGGMFIALDVTAGEKERGTLEALLVTPASDQAIFIGKLAAVFTVAAIPLALTFIGYWLASALMPDSMTGGAVLPFGVITKTILLALPVTLLANVIVMLISIRSKAFKDAQTAVTPIVFLFMIPAFAAAFAPPTGANAFMIPVYGIAAAVGSIASGGVIPDNALLFSVVGSLLTAVVAIVVGMRLFDRERLLYSV